MVDNVAIAELFIREAETAQGPREQAFRRAAHAAFVWPEEGTDIAAAGRSLTELAGIGSLLAKRLHNWIASPPEVEVPAIRYADRQDLRISLLKVARKEGVRISIRQRLFARRSAPTRTIRSSSVLWN